MIRLSADLSTIASAKVEAVRQVLAKADDSWSDEPEPKTQKIKLKTIFLCNLLTYSCFYTTQPVPIGDKMYSFFLIKWRFPGLQALACYLLNPGERQWAWKPIKRMTVVIKQRNQERSSFYWGNQELRIIRINDQCFIIPTIEVNARAFTILL